MEGYPDMQWQHVAPQFYLCLILGEGDLPESHTNISISTHFRLLFPNTDQRDRGESNDYYCLLLNSFGSEIFDRTREEGYNTNRQGED
jgi:hypothetical protein